MKDIQKRLCHIILVDDADNQQLQTCLIVVFSFETRTVMKEQWAWTSQGRAS